MRAKRLRLMRQCLETLGAEGQLLVLSLDEPHEIRIRIMPEIVHVIEPLQRLAVGDNLHDGSPLLLHEPEECESRVPGAGREQRVIWVRNLVEGGV